MSDDRKVIPFKKQFKKQMVKTTPNDLRAAATGTLAFILLLMVGVNFQLFETDNNQQAQRLQKTERGLASVPKVLNPQWKKNSLSDDSQEPIVDGQRPSPIDKLTYGYLKGNYSFTVENGIVRNIHFLNSKNSNPQVVQNRQLFIEEHGRAFVPDLKSIGSSQVEATSDGYKESFVVKTASATQIIDIYMSKNNELLKITVF